MSDRDVYSHPTSSTYFLEKIKTDTLEDHEGTVRIGDRTINLRFSDDIDGLVGEEKELTKLVERLGKAFIPYGMEISAEKTTLIKKTNKQTKNPSGINTEIKVNGEKPEIVTSFKYPGLVVTDEGSKPKDRRRQH